MRFKLIDLGLVDFKEAWQFQKEIFVSVMSGCFESVLVVCRHYPVITLGRLGNRENILLSEEELKRELSGFYRIERAGDVTYHGPGQITIYPVFNLRYLKKDIHLFLRYLEEVVICFLSDFGIKALRKIGLTGVWIEDKKISSIGISIKNWITFHGVSVNIKQNDLVNFDYIRPCGMDIKMTSLETVLGREVDINIIKSNLINRFADILKMKYAASFLK